MSTPQFVLCPHCEGLLVRDPVTGQPPAQCRHCGQPVDPAMMAADAATAEDQAGTEPPLASGRAVLPDETPTEAPTGMPGNVTHAHGPHQHGTDPMPVTPTSRVASPANAGYDDVQGDVQANGHDTGAVTVSTPPAAASADPSGIVAADADTERASDADSDGDGDVGSDGELTTPLGTAATTSSARPAPRFATQAVTRAVSRRTWAVVAVLAVVLGLQALLAQRAALAADARWRPLILAVCGVLQCRVPAWHDPAAFEMLERNVAATPGQPGVLTLSARYRQQARWPQAWPVLQVQLLDADGRVLGVGRYAPAQYLGHAPTTALLVPGIEVQAQWRVREPPGGAVAFQFDFL